MSQYENNGSKPPIPGPMPGADYSVSSPGPTSIGGYAEGAKYDTGVTAEGMNSKMEGSHPHGSFHDQQVNDDVDQEGLTTQTEVPSDSGETNTPQESSIDYSSVKKDEETKN